jgi:peptidoglycan hydrolase-like protein with peptidoglycan-binding domain
VAVGDTVYVVGSTPVRVVRGDRPFYRDLGPGSRGWDVTQLQNALTMLGYRTGPADGVFGSGTATAVRAWQKHLGQPQTGTVALGELVAVRQLPSAVRLGERVTVGTRLAGGEDALLAPTGVREFVLVVGAQQASLIPAEARVEVTFQDHTWQAVIAQVRQDENGGVEHTLTAPDGGTVCGSDCDALPGDTRVTLRSRVIVTPTVTGTTVPAAAVHTRPDGTAYVLTRAGQVDVEILGSGQGIVVITGIADSTPVQLGATRPSAPGPNGSNGSNGSTGPNDPPSSSAPATTGQG